MTQSLFRQQIHQPLAEIMRPQSIDDIIGQESVIGPQSPIGQLIRKGYVPSLIIWGPPGCGKTTFAQILARQSRAEFISLNATDAGVKQIRECGEAGQKRRIEENIRTILFVDEIHRFNKSQQDVLLPFVEKGDLILVGATTENPSYELNRALLSRCQVLVFKNLKKADLLKLIEKFETLVQSEINLSIADEAKDFLIEYSNGDARKLINMLEILRNHRLFSLQSSDLTQSDLGSKYQESYNYEIQNSQIHRPLSAEELQSKHSSLNEEFAQNKSCGLDTELLINNFKTQVVQNISLSDVRELFKNHPISYDKKSEFHYDLISAFIKSVRGSDPDAAIYYMARMLEGGEDPVFIARRLIILASEDIGNADPRALTMAVSGLQAVEAIGLPEAAITLAQVTTYLATAPKSNRSYLALNKAREFISEKSEYPIPLKLRSSGTTFSKSLGYGQDYKYPHDLPRSWVEQEYLPAEMRGIIFYEPKEIGYEKHIIEFLSWLKNKAFKKL